MIKKSTNVVPKLSQQIHFRKALKNAQGRADQVIVIFVDVRGFSAFSSSRDSVDIALYVRRLFLSLINKHYSKAGYYKSTGDGMMIVYPYQEKTLAKIASQVIASSIDLLFEFPHLADNDEMITFEAPKSCGIGINRGTVCCIESEGEILDYSGHVLNLAARLVDFARPEGIVMHASLGNYIPAEYMEAFEISSIYLRGIAENQPLPIYSLEGITSIPKEATVPLLQQWGEFIKKWTAEEVKKLGRFTIDVPNTVTKPEDVVSRFYTPGSLKGLRTINDLDHTDIKIKKVADRTEISIDLRKLKSMAVAMQDEEGITLEVKYRQN